MDNIDHVYCDDATGTGHALGVVDDFDGEWPVSAAELDALQAFLMPLINAVMAGEPIVIQSSPLPSMKKRGVTHKRRKAAN